MTISQVTNDKATEPPWDEEETTVTHPEDFEEREQNPAWWYVIDHRNDVRTKIYGTAYMENNFFTLYDENFDIVAMFSSRDVHVLRADVFQDNYTIPAGEQDDD